MERLSSLTAHLSPNPTFAAVKDPDASRLSLNGGDLFNMKGKVCLVTGGSRVSQITEPIQSCPLNGDE